MEPIDLSKYNISEEIEEILVEEYEKENDKLCQACPSRSECENVICEFRLPGAEICDETFDIWHY